MADWSVVDTGYRRVPRGARSDLRAVEKAMERLMYEERVQEKQQQGANGALKSDGRFFRATF